MENNITSNRPGRRTPPRAVIIEPQEFDRRCQEYLAICKNAGRRPTKPGLAIHLGVTSGTLDKWEKSGEERHKAYTESIKKVMDAISDELQQGKDAMSVFLLKQPCYGGYRDDGMGGIPDHIKVTVSFGGKQGKGKKALDSTK